MELEDSNQISSQFSSGESSSASETEENKMVVIVESPENAENHKPVEEDSDDDDMSDNLVIDESKCEIETPGRHSQVKTIDDVPVMFHDPTLPSGWVRKVQQRTMGASAGKYDVYIYSPDGKKIRSKTDLIVYLQRNHLDLNADDFDFTVRGRSHSNSIRKTNLTPFKSKSKTSNGGSPLLVQIKQSTGNDKLNQLEKAMQQKKTDKAVPAQPPSQPKMIVKFQFPIARLKRSTSFKKKFKSKQPKLEQSTEESTGDNSQSESEYDKLETTRDGSSDMSEHSEHVLHDYTQPTSLHDKLRLALDDNENTSSSIHSSVEETAILEVE